MYEIFLDRKTVVSPMLDWFEKTSNGQRTSCMCIFKLRFAQNQLHVPGSWKYEYGCSRYKTVMVWDLYFTFAEISHELIEKLDPTEAIL